MSLRESLFKNYMECKTLLEIESKKDPETDPYRSKKKVNEILLKDADIVKNYIEQTDTKDPDHEFCRLYLSLILAYIGIGHVDMDEYSEGVDYLMKCLDLIEDPLLPHTVYVSVEARNHLGYASLRRSKPEEGVKFLEEAEKLYYDFRSNHTLSAKNVFEYMENPPVLGEEELEMAHTMTKFFLAQAYDVLKDLFKSSVCCHETLKRQLKHKNFDPIDWAMNSANLCQFFMDKMLFKQGRCHLAAANHILDQYGDNLRNMEGTQEEIEAKKEEFRHRSADLSWCWAKYGSYILQHSRYKLSGLEDDTVDEKYEDLEKLSFDNLDLTHYENQVTDVDVVAFEDAREVFLFSQRHFNKAKEYYTLEDRASAHVRIIRDHSQLFSLLFAFEPDEVRQLKMLKKRTDMLEVVLKELNPRYYMDVCRQLWFELGEVYHDMMQIKSRKIEELPTPQTLKKVNSWIESSVENFNHFLDSVKDKKTGKLPDILEEDLISPALTALFYLGRLHVKYVTPDKHSQAKNLKKACEFFKYVVDYCDKSEKAKAIIDEKYQTSKEMFTLLQLRLLQL